jgi:hypothetical protein
MTQASSTSTQGVDYDRVKDRFNKELGLETAFSEDMALQVLHARLHCGLHLFDGSKIDEALDVAPCIIKWVCKVMVQLEKRGELLETLTQMERDFAATGNNRLNKDAKCATLCRKCVQHYCPFWKLVKDR